MYVRPRFPTPVVHRFAPGDMLGHYRIAEKIGQGGMGEVYLGRDEHLGRNVAIKVLPLCSLADSKARKRFRKEADALSKLNHPNIATIYDFDTEKGLDFLVMEYIPGKILSDRLREGHLLEKEVVRLGLELVDALAAAHEQGVIHRDLKPGNLRLTNDQRLKILDFGLARLVGCLSPMAKTESALETVVLAGTLPYMAPEQLRGSAGDVRTDLYSAGVVLYELTTGRLPFPEKVPTALSDDIIHQAPPPPGRLRPDISPRLEEIILKSLEKDPDNRYQSAKELAVDLRRLQTSVSGELPSPSTLLKSPSAWTFRITLGVLAAIVTVLITVDTGNWRERVLGRGGYGTPQIQSLAVLPLANLSGDSQQQYFADGMTDELIATLGRVRVLRVISRTSVMRYKDIHAPLRDVAQALHVDAVVEGTVARYGDHVRINAEMFRAADEKQLWSESYESDLRDVLKLQRDVARSIVQEINLHIASADLLSEKEVASVNPDAYEAYLKGRFYLHDRTVAGFQTALMYFQQAIAKDEHYAAAYAGIADTYLLLSVEGPLSPSEAMPKAEAAALKALQLDDSLPEALTSLASSRWLYRWNWRESERLFRKAIEKGPNYAPAHHYYALYLSSAGRWREAMTEIHRAQGLDPLSPAISANVAWCQYVGRQYNDAITSALRTAEIYPNFGTTYGYLGQIYVEVRRSQDAVQALQKAIQLSGENQLYQAELAYTYARSGDQSQAYALIAKIRRGSQQEGITAYALAMAYSGIGDKDAAIFWLKKAVAQHDAHVVNLNVHPAFVWLHSDRRFSDLIRELGVPLQSSLLSKPPVKVIELVGPAEAWGTPTSAQEIRSLFLAGAPTPAA